MKCKCGGDFTPAFDKTRKPIWQCVKCSHTEPRVDPGDFDNSRDSAPESFDTGLGDIHGIDQKK